MDAPYAPEFSPAQSPGRKSSNGVKPFACTWEDCYKAFQRRSDLSRHMRIHLNERPFVCPEPNCQKSFIQRSALTVHYRVHTGEKPHKCQQCGRAFSDSSSLARHRRVHTGARPYVCTVNNCNRSFCRKTTLLKHQKRNHNVGGSDDDGQLEMDDDDEYEDEYVGRSRKAVKSQSVGSTPSSPRSGSSFNPRVVQMPMLTMVHPLDHSQAKMSMPALTPMQTPVFVPSQGHHDGSPMSTGSHGSHHDGHSGHPILRSPFGEDHLPPPHYSPYLEQNTAAFHRSVYLRDMHHHGQMHLDHPGFHPYDAPHPPPLVHHSHSFSHGLPAITSFPGPPLRRFSLPRYAEPAGEYDELESPMSSNGPITPAQLNGYSLSHNANGSPQFDSAHEESFSPYMQHGQPNKGLGIEYSSS